jgi:hypothetical protein
MSIAGLKYRWKISPKKSYRCSLIAAPQISDVHPYCAPETLIEEGVPEKTRTCFRNLSRRTPTPASVRPAREERLT